MGYESFIFFLIQPPTPSQLENILSMLREIPLDIIILSILLNYPWGYEIK